MTYTLPGTDEKSRYVEKKFDQIGQATLKKNPDYFFLRHGETAFNRAGVLHGQLDSKLTDLGISQAQEQGKFLKNLK